MKDVIDFIKDIDIPSAEEIIDEAKDQITDPIAETVEEALPDNPAFKQALADCVMNAKKNLGWSYPFLGPTWIQACLLRKGFSIGKDWLEKNI